VSPTELRIGNVSQISGLVPNFARTAVNGIKAYFNYVNSQGGVCGRRLRLIEADDRFQSATNRAETDKLSSQVIAFGGSLSVVDDGGAPILDEKGVADVSLATTAPRIAAKNNFSPNPIDPTPGAGAGFTPALVYFKETFGVSKPAIFYQDVATGVNQSNNYKVNFQEAGIPVVATYPVAPTATNFQSQATDMQQKGIDLVITVAEVNAMANLARAFGDIGYFPKVPFYGAQSYGQKFLQLAGSSAEGTMAALIFAIPEEGTPEVKLMADWYKRTAPGADLDFFALLSWVAGEMLVGALRAAGPDPTQAKVVAELSKLTEFKSTIAAPSNPAGKKPSPCFHVVEVKGGKWQKQYPDSGFDC
jgi:ABC-type branched-subunit amino acid transport system substrate-binding protein